MINAFGLLYGMPLISLDNLEDDRLEVYRNLKHTNRTRWQNTFIAESKRVVRRLVESDFEIESILVSHKRIESISDWLPADVLTFVLPHSLIEQLIGFNFHMGVMACGKRKINPLLSDFVSTTRRSTIVACRDVMDPENMGTIIRLCTAFGVDGLLLGHRSADPLSRRSLRVSMANALNLPIIQSSDFQQHLKELHERWQYDVAGTVLDDSAENLTQANRSDRLVIVFGNESEGLDQETLSLCNRQITLPMQGGTDSVNVAVAAGIFLYHLTRLV
ncbi:MAG: rRNA methylase [Planctomycetaceae bacterium]|nr:rRNA methylase [Planctomycetaceae bacterium]